jgi:transposase-like protein
VDEVVLSLYAKCLTTGEISAHFAEIYGVRGGLAFDSACYVR